MTITREDLEMAAKAAGMPVHYDEVTDTCFIKHGGEFTEPWRPEEDDGDCARMEDAVCITIWRYSDYIRVRAFLGKECFTGRAAFADHGNDRGAARRYASVKLAAAVGRAM